MMRKDPPWAARIRLSEVVCARQGRHLAGAGYQLPPVRGQGWWCWRGRPWWGGAA